MTVYLLDDNKAFYATFETAFRAELKRLEKEAVLYAYSDASAMEAQLCCAAPDICFLDIELAQGQSNGLAVAERVRRQFPGCQIIFLTNYLQYVTSAFDVQPVYYILKTELTRRLPAALALALRKLSRREDAKLELTIQRKSVVIAQSSIIYLDHKQRITTIHCTGSNYETRELLSRLLPQLDGKRFFQCHYSFIINLRQVQAISGRQFLMKDSTEIPISRACYSEAKNVFTAFLAGSLQEEYAL